MHHIRGEREGRELTARQLRNEYNIIQRYATVMLFSILSNISKHIVVSVIEEAAAACSTTKS